MDELRPHLTVFVTLLEQHCIPLLLRVAATAREADKPTDFLTNHQGIYMALPSL